LPSRPFRYSNWHRYLGIAVAIVCAIGTLFIFRALRMEQSHHVARMTHLASEAIREDLIADMQARTLAEARFAAMWKGDTLTRRNWDLNASLLMGHHSGSLAVFWLDGSGHAVWATYNAPANVRLATIPNQPLLDTLPRLRVGDPHPLLSPVFKTPNGQLLRWSITNAQSRSGDSGYVAVLYDAKESLAGMLRDVEGLGYAISATEHATHVYSFAKTPANGAGRAELTTVTLPGDTLEVAVWPTPETLEQLQSHLPQAALLIALTLSVLVIIATRLATVARLRSRDLQMTNEQLMLEMRERERIEAALSRSRARFAAILDMSGDAIVCCNEHGVITLFNESAERMFQQKAEEIIGEGIDNIIGGAVQEGGASSNDESRSEAVALLHRSAHITARRKDDSRFPADVTVSILDVEQEKIVTVILRDVTERHRMERELRSAHGQLETRVAERTQQLAESVFLLQAEVNLRNQAERSLRELSARILQLQDSERRRIARELHDSTAQVLVAASMNMATVQEHVAATGDAIVAGIIQDTSHLIEQAQSEIRTISYLLHPPLLEELGLASAIDWYASGFSKRSGVQVTFDVARDLGRLPQDYELTLFRIVQEALTNVHRHSHSRTAQIYLARDEESIHLEIADQGSGVENGKLKALDSGGTLGVGIAGMRERVRQLGGTVTMASNGNGTVITAHIPLIGELAGLNFGDDLASRECATQTAVA
jgi:two-component system NarL family sensor kinase